MKDKSDSLHALLLETRKLLAFHQQCGFDYPLTEELQAVIKPKAQLPKQALPGRPSPSTQFTPKPSPPLPEKQQKKADITLKDLEKEQGDCRRCGLDKTERAKIFGEGQERTGLPLFIVCDSQEDMDKGSQLPITDEPRELLIKMLGAINLSLNDVYLTNSIKCRCSPGGSATKTEIAACSTFLQRQIEILKPKIICTMGQDAANSLLKTSQNIFSLRGKFRTFLDIPLMPTLHPSMLLKHPEMKKGAWHDLQMIQKKLAEIGVS